MNAPGVSEAVWKTPGAGHQLFYRLWRPLQATRLLVIVHGFGEHGGRYQLMAQALFERGIAVAVPDLLGHGRSSGPRGDANTLAEYLDDLQAFTEHVALPGTGQERFAVYGHSFGGLVGICWALRHPLQLERLVAQAPLLAVGFPVPKWKTIAADWLGRCWPSVGLSIDLDPSALSHDQDVVRAYQTDPFVHNRISARVYHYLLTAAQQALEHASEIQVPTLVLYGEADRIVSLDTARRWFDALTCRKRLVSFPGAYHELHHEGVREQVIRLIEEWITGP